MSNSTSRYIPRKSQSEKPLTLKGATEALKVDKNEIERVLITLRKNPDQLIAQANNQTNLYIKVITDNARKLYRTSSYKDFYEQILKHFSNVGNILPGTISALMVGNYFYKGEMPSKSYAPTCIDSLPTPEDENIPQEDKNISIVYRDDTSKKSIVSMMKNLSRTDNIVVLMGDIDVSTSYLYQNELRLLKDINVEKYDLYTYINGYYKIVKASKPLSMALQHRPNKNIHKESNYMVGVFFVIGLAVLLLLLILFANRSSK